MTYGFRTHQKMMRRRCCCYYWYLRPKMRRKKRYQNQIIVDIVFLKNRFMHLINTKVLCWNQIFESRVNTAFLYKVYGEVLFKSCTFAKNQCLKFLRILASFFHVSCIIYLPIYINAFCGYSYYMVWNSADICGCERWDDAEHYYLPISDSVLHFEVQYYLITGAKLHLTKIESFFNSLSV